jgi:hypothetical protein
MFETFNATVDSVDGPWEHAARSYGNDDMFPKFLNATPQKIKNMWQRFHSELDTCYSEDHIHNIRNINDKESNRLSLFGGDVERLDNGVWLANSVNDVLPNNLFTF